MNSRAKIFYVVALQLGTGGCRTTLGQSSQLRGTEQTCDQLAEGILAKKIDDARGSNEGGIYRGKDGVNRYVKFYTDPSQGYGEALSGKIYRDLGIGAPIGGVVPYRGANLFASEIIEDTRQLGLAFSKEEARKVLDGFVADVMVANWDALGMVGDNILVKRTTNELIRVDNGGTFFMRAMRGQKQRELLFEITEWNNFRNPSINMSYARVFARAGLSDAELNTLFKAQLKKVQSLLRDHGNWHNYILKHYPNIVTETGFDWNDFAKMLTERQRKIEEILQ